MTAFRISMENNYDYLVKIDGDGQQDVNLLSSLINELKQNTADIVTGSRYVQKQIETDSFIKVIGRNVSSALINFKLCGKNHISDCTTGIRAWNKKSIKCLTKIYFDKNISHDSVFWVREAIIASNQNLKILEIPTFYNKREYGESKSFSPINMCTFPLRLIGVLIS